MCFSTTKAEAPHIGDVDCLDIGAHWSCAGNHRLRTGRACFAGRAQNCYALSGSPGICPSRRAHFSHELSTTAFLLFNAQLRYCCRIAAAQNQNSSIPPTMNIPKPPATKQQPVTDDYFGHKIVDPLPLARRWQRPETEHWVAEQLAYTRSVLDKLPGRDQLARSLAAASRNRHP